MDTNPQTFGIQSHYTNSVNCNQPKFIQVPIFLPFIGEDGYEVVTMEWDIDFTTAFFDNNKIDFVQGVIAKFYATEGGLEQIPNDTQNLFSPTGAYLKFTNGFILHLGSYGGTGGNNFEIARQIYMDRSTKIKLVIYSTNTDGAQNIRGINAQLYFTNSVVQPYEIFPEQATGA